MKAFKAMVIAFAMVALLSGIAQAGGGMTRDKALAEIEKDFGFVPNLLQEMSVSPVSPLVYTRSDKLMHGARLSQKDQQVVQLVTSLFNSCNYCSSAHSKFAELNGVRHSDVLAIRQGKTAQEKRVNDLVWVTRSILEKRGHLSGQDLKAVAEMGISKAELYEILVHIGRKMIANYAVHIINPEVDKQFMFTE